MVRIPVAILALASIVSLAACGAGGSEFAARTAAACVKEEGQAAAAKCACQAKLVDQTLNDKEKKFILTTLDAQDLGPEAGMKALTDSGLTIADMMSMGQRMAELEPRINSECAA